MNRREFLRLAVASGMIGAVGVPRNDFGPAASWAVPDAMHRYIASFRFASVQPCTLNLFAGKRLIWQGWSAYVEVPSYCLALFPRVEVSPGEELRLRGPGFVCVEMMRERPVDVYSLRPADTERLWLFGSGDNLSLDEQKAPA